MPTPRYPDPDAERRGETLLAAWSARERDPEAWRAARDAARIGPALWPGEWVADRYRLLESAGDAPIATTWSAWDGVADAPVSVVVLHGQLAADPAAIRAFEAAARAGGPGRPAVADPGGTWSGFRWFALAGAPGRRLHAAVVGGLGPASALQAVLEAGSALADLHAAGGVHGLISPDAIRLPTDGPAALADAGLATARTAAGVAWLAPERLDPNVPATAASDVYGLAMCALFALNGGDLPFWAWRAPERLVSSLDLPEPAASTLVGAVAWDPAERLDSVKALCAALLATDELRLSVARACLEAGRPRDALDHLDALAARRPGDPGLLVDRARALESLDPEAATTAWYEALERHHTRDQGRAALQALVGQARGAELVEHGRALLPLLPAAERPALHHRLGRVLLDELGDREAALPHLEQALAGGVKARDLARLVERLRTERGDWRDVLELRVQRGELRTAVAIARSALRSDPRPLRQQLLAAGDDADALRDELAAVVADGGDPDPLLERLAALGPARPAEDVLRARSLIAKGRSEEALVVLLAARAAHPGHLGTLEALGSLHRTRGELAAARDAYATLAEALDGQPRSALGVRAEHARAEVAWLLGDAPTAATAWHRLLDRDGDDRAAWWGLARVAFDPPADQPWLGATPVVFTPEEALARLLAGLLDPAAMNAWLALPEAVAGTPLVTAARLVDALVRRGDVGPAFFTALVIRFPEAGLPIEAVRWLWCEPPAEPLFSLPDTYRWTGVSERFDRRVTRRVQHLRARRVTPTEPNPDWEPLLERRPGPLAIEGAWTGGTPPMAPERELRLVLAGPDVGHLDLVGERLTAGGDADDDLLLPGIAPGRLRLENAADTWYVVADEPFLADGVPVTERRLTPGLRLEVDGQPLRLHRLPAGAPIPEERDDLLLDLPLDGAPLTPHAVLIHRDGAREDVLPFEGDALALGPDPARPVVAPGAPYLYRLARTDAGYTLEDRTDEGGSELPAVLPLQHGDTFAIGDRSFTFQIRGASDTPALAPSREDRRAMVPLLVLLDDDDDTEHVLPLIDDVFSIGRSGGNDLQLSDDAEISRQHCVLVRGTDGACILRDSGSANGTHVNGRAIERHILQVGDVIQVGGARLEFRLGRREDLEQQLQDLVLDEMEETTSSRAETAAFQRPARRK